jgi:hypothetical protein
MQPLRESLRRLLDAHQPNPALIVDGLWNLIEANPAVSLLWDGADEALLEPPINMLRLARASRRPAADLLDDGGLQHAAHGDRDLPARGRRERGAAARAVGAGRGAGLSDDLTAR